MMSLRTVTVIALVSVGSFIGWTHVVKGNGARTTQKRAVGAFDEIDVRGAVDVEVKVGGPLSVEVESDDNILPLVATDVQNGTLQISTRDSYATRLGIHVRVVVPELSALRISGSGDVQATGFDGGELATKLDGSGDLELSGKLARLVIASAGSGDVRAFDLDGGRIEATLDGSGDLELSGKSERLEVTVKGSGDVSAEALEAKSADIEIRGSGDAEIKVIDQLRARVSGSGDVRYAGKPTHVDGKVTGAGSVEPL